MRSSHAVHPAHFILGTHEPSWLARPECAAVPLMVSDRRLRDMTTLPRALGWWMLDSGGFTELQLFGRWTVNAAEYVARVRRYMAEIGGLKYVAPQDWMCEDIVRQGGVVGRGQRRTVFAGTGLSIAEHLRRTVDNFLELRQLAPEVPWVPTLQGWTVGDYLDCAEMYFKAGVDLAAAPLVGVGTMCRRQNSMLAGFILRELASHGWKLHGFGLKKEGLRAHGDALLSADSLAWSDHAKHHPPLLGHDRPGPGRPRGHKACNNCLDFALLWRDELLAGFERAVMTADELTLAAGLERSLLEARAIVLAQEPDGDGPEWFTPDPRGCATA